MHIYCWCTSYLKEHSYAFFVNYFLNNYFVVSKSLNVLVLQFYYEPLDGSKMGSPCDVCKYTMLQARWAVPNMNIRINAGIQCADWVKNIYKSWKNIYWLSCLLTFYSYKPKSNHIFFCIFNSKSNLWQRYEIWSWLRHDY